jgi:hypothetical protein
MAKPIELESFANFITDLDYKHNYKVTIRYLNITTKNPRIGKIEKINMILVRLANR